LQTFRSYHEAHATNFLSSPLRDYNSAFSILHSLVVSM
jgi:hypothetical protein